MNNRTMDNVITGHELELLLTKVETIIEESDDNGEALKEIKANIYENNCIPHNFDALSRLHRLLFRVDAVEADNTAGKQLKEADGESPEQSQNQAVPIKHTCKALLDQYGDTLLSQLNGDDEETYEARISLASMKVDAEGYSFASMLRLVRAIDTEKIEKQEHYQWDYLCDLASDHKHFAIERTCLEKMHVIEQIEETKEAESEGYHLPNPQLSLARLHIRLARSFKKEGIDKKQNECIDDALHALSQISQLHSDDTDTLIDLTKQIIEMRPDSLTQITTHIQHATPADMPVPHQYDIRIRLARIEAAALYKAGKLTDAIHKGFEGYYGTTHDYNEPDITALLYNWLYEAKDYDRLAALLYESGQREDMHHDAVKWTKKLLNDGIEKTALPALLVVLATDSDSYHYVQQTFGIPRKQRAAWLEKHINTARAWAKTEHDHGLANLAEGLWLFQRNKRNQKDAYHTLLPLLEKGIGQAPDCVDMQVLFALLTSRMFVHGLDAAFDMPFVPASTASWCYNMGCGFDDDDPLAERVKSLGKWPAEKATLLEIQYYRHGKQRFEEYFKSGKGRFRDADVHVYSMLCNNLAISLKYHYDDYDIYDESIAIHKQGIALSPFAEHYYGIMRSYSFKNDDDNQIIAADELWRFVQKHGYSRFDVYDDVMSIADTYANAGRQSEIATWITRLQQWWEKLEEYEQDDERDQYLTSLTYCLVNWAVDKPEDAVTVMTPLLEEINDSDISAPLQNAAMLLQNTNEHERALPLLEKALPLAVAEDNVAAKNIEALIKASRKFIARKDKSWWKFW